MKGKLLLALAVLLAGLAAVLRLYPFDRQPPPVSLSPAPGRYGDPVRVTLTSEPDALLFLAIDGAEPSPYLGPVTLRRDARLRAFARDRAGNQSAPVEAAFVVRIDKEPPRTTATPPGGEYDYAISVALATEEGAVIRYTTDGSEPGDSSPAYREPLSLLGGATIKFFATDEAGNREPTRTEVYAIDVDTTKPVTLAEPSGGVYNRAVSVKLTAEDGSTIHYTLDGSRPTERSPRYGKPVAVDRTSVLKFFAVDGSGNREDVRELSYVIDTVPPSVRADPPPGAFPKPLVVRLASNEPGEIRYEAGGGPPRASSPVYGQPIPVAKDTVLTFFATDRAGNRSQAVTAAYVVDTVPPEAVARPPGGSYSGRIRVKIETSEPAEVHFTRDGTPATPRSERYTGPISVDRNTVLSFLAVDALGNVGKAVSQTYVLDQDAPSTRAEPPGGTFTAPFDVALLSEDGSVVRYTLDGSEPGPSSPVYRAPIRLSRDTVVRFFATDASGNREPSRTERYAFDRTPPSTAIEPAPGAYNRPISVSLRSDKGGQVLFRLDEGGEYKAYTGPFVLDRSARVSYYAQDAAGNREAVRTADYLVDAEPPVTTPYPAPGEYNPPIALELRSEEGARVHFTLDGGRPTESSPVYSGPVSLREAATVRFFAVDRAGNREDERSASYTVASGLWRRNTNGVFIHPSVLDGDLLWVGGEEGLFEVHIETKRKRSFDTGDGLISNSVRAIAVDRLGFKWVGTDRGVSQFDGKRTWVTFDYSDGLPSNAINCVVIDPLERIWFGTDRGLAVLEDRRFRTLTVADGLPDNNVRGLAIDANAVFWVATGKGLWRYAGKERRVFTTADGLPSDNILSVAVDGRWNVWVGTRGQGVGRYDGVRWTRYGPAEGMPGREVRVIAVDRADNKWFGTEAGVFRYDGRGFSPVAMEVYR